MDQIAIEAAWRSDSSVPEEGPYDDGRAGGCTVQEDEGACRCCCCTGECAGNPYELEDTLSLGMVEGDYELN